MDTVPYLVQQHNVEIPRLDLNPEDLYEMETYQAYRHAACIIRNSNPSELVQAKFTELSCPRQVLSELGVGSVPSYDDYFRRMTASSGGLCPYLCTVRITRRS